MPFVEEQKLSLEREGYQIDYFYIRGKGISGYLKNLTSLKDTINKADYKLIHAHYGLAGLLASLQRKIPVIITYHGSDINIRKNRIFSFIASRLCDFNIFVNKAMPGLLHVHENFSIIPCGVDETVFNHLDMSFARKKLGLDLNKKYILFSSAFDNPVKNYSLANMAVSSLNFEVSLLELKGFSREQVCLFLNACDLLLMTSFSEGSPQIVKEALFCGTPVVSTKVGDVPDLLNGVVGCYLANSDAHDIAKKIEAVFANPVRVGNHTFISDLSLRTVAKKMVEIYRRFA